jgi:Xaa-Pro aminopeptidase
MTDFYPRFSDDEMQRRREALAAAMAERDVAHALIYGAERAGSAVAWLTRWPVTREAFVIFTPGERDLLLVRFYNHVPNAQRMAVDADVAPADPGGIERVVAELSRRGARGRRVGVVGPLGFRDHARLRDTASEVVDLNGAYARLRLVKSAEEIVWVRQGAALTDRALAALRDGARPGMDEHTLGDLVERAYVPRGGATHIHYFGATSMAEPTVVVPSQWPSSRVLAAGDALTCELSAAFWGYPGQVLRTFAVAADPVPLYRDLHAAADAAFDSIVARLRPGATAAELVDAASPIEDAGYTTRDDLVHGFVGGYLAPVLGSPSRALEPVPEFVFEEGMTVVVQPNVVTRDEHAGVQTGELVLVGRNGAERLHDAPRGLLRIG